MFFFLLVIAYATCAVVMGCRAINYTYVDFTASKCTMDTLVNVIDVAIPATSLGGKDCGKCYVAGGNSIQVGGWDGDIATLMYIGVTDCSKTTPDVVQYMQVNQSVCGATGVSTIATYEQYPKNETQWWPKTLLFAGGNCNGKPIGENLRRHDRCLPVNSTHSTHMNCSMDAKGGMVKMWVQSPNCGMQGTQASIDATPPMGACFPVDDPSGQITGLMGKAASCTPFVTPKALIPTPNCDVAIHTFDKDDTTCDPESMGIRAIELTSFDLILGAQGRTEKCGVCKKSPLSDFASYKLYSILDGSVSKNVTVQWSWNGHCQGDPFVILSQAMPTCNTYGNADMKKIVSVGVKTFPAITNSVTSNFTFAFAQAYMAVDTFCQQRVAIAKVRTDICAGGGKYLWRKVVCKCGGGTATAYADKTSCDAGTNVQKGPDTFDDGVCSTASTVLDNFRYKSYSCPVFTDCTKKTEPKGDAATIMLSFLALLIALFV